MKPLSRKMPFRRMAGGRISRGSKNMTGLRSMLRLRKGAKISSAKAVHIIQQVCFHWSFSSDYAMS
jgi:hypothetical protein